MFEKLWLDRSPVAILLHHPPFSVLELFAQVVPSCLPGWDHLQQQSQYHTLDNLSALWDHSIFQSLLSGNGIYLFFKLKTNKQKN